MTMQRKQIPPTERKMSGQAVALGVIGFLALAVGFFFLGMLGLGPLLREQVKVPEPVVNSRPARPVPRPIEQPVVETPKDSAGEQGPSLDVEVTEDGEQPAEPGDTVTQDGNTLTITLDPDEPKADESATPSEDSDADPKPEVVEPRPSAHGASTPPAGKMVYRVQAGTFANRDNADTLVKDLKKHGYKPEVKIVQAEAGTLFRVELGEYKTKEGAQDLADDLSAQGYNPAVTSSRKQP